MRIMIVEEDRVLQKMLATNLKEYGFVSDVVETLKNAEYYYEIRNYDLILMASKLSDGDSVDVISDIKSNYPKMTIIIMSDSDAPEDEIKALRAGADDYIKKPFDFNILLARIKCRLKTLKTNIIEFELLSINPEEERIIYDGRNIELKGKPFEVLAHLARHRNRTFSKEELLDALWEEPELVTPSVIEVAINIIRQKIDKQLDITTIETVRRRGYRFSFPKTF